MIVYSNEQFLLFSCPAVATGFASLNSGWIIITVLGIIAVAGCIVGGFFIFVKPDDSFGGDTGDMIPMVLGIVAVFVVIGIAAAILVPALGIEQATTPCVTQPLLP